MKDKKRLDLSKSEFTANGNNYYIEHDITIERYRVFEKYSMELAFGADFETHYNNLGNIINLFNDHKDVEAKAGLWNIYTSIKNKIENRTDRALKLCSIFILREDEKPEEYSEKIEREKIEDWVKEGFIMNDFFTLAFNLIPGLLDALNSDSLTDSENKEQQK